MLAGRRRARDSPISSLRKKLLSLLLLHWRFSVLVFCILRWEEKGKREERKKKRRREMTNHKRRSLARLDGHAAGGEKAAFAFPPPPHKSLFCFVSFFFARFFFFFCSLSLRSFMRSVSTEERRMGKGGDFLFSLPLRKTSRKKKEMSANF